MVEWNEVQIPSFKDTHGGFPEYLLRQLQSGNDIKDDECTAQIRRGGFAGATKLLKNTDRTKVVVTSLHIPNQEGKIHHYDINLYRFSRTKPSNPADWRRQIDFSLRKEEVQALYQFLTEQNELVGIKFDAKYASVVFSDNETIVLDLIEKLGEIIDSSGGQEMLDQLVSEIINHSHDVEGKVLTIGYTDDVIENRRAEIDSFEAIVNNPGSKEVGDIQAALKEIPWIFGPEYTGYDFKKAGDEIPDGRLKRIDGLSDILEVKLPGEEVLRVDANGRRFISPKCAEAIGQLTSYLEYYQSAYTTEHDDETEEEVLEDRHQKYYKPKGILLIGRRYKEKIEGTGQKSDNHPKYMRRVMSYFHGIEILTYDDLIERARNTLAIIEESKSSLIS